MKSLGDRVTPLSGPREKDVHRSVLRLHIIKLGTTTKKLYVMVQRDKKPESSYKEDDVVDLEIRATRHKAAAPQCTE